MTANDWFDQGNALALQGNSSSAIGAFEEAIRLDPQHFRAWNNMAFLLREQGRYDEALGAFDMAVEIDPQYTMAWNNMGTTLASLAGTRRPSWPVIRQSR
jgi:tetratricopeptide (TPR) repeat protein